MALSSLVIYTGIGGNQFGLSDPCDSAHNHTRQKTTFHLVSYYFENVMQIYPHNFARPMRYFLITGGRVGHLFQSYLSGL